MISSARYVFFVLLGSLLLCSCAEIQRKPNFSAGVVKNSIPIVLRERVEVVHSIAIPPFYGDKHYWRSAAQQVLVKAPRVTVIDPVKIDAVVRERNWDLLSMPPARRVETLAAIGKTLGVDAVVNGIILGDSSKGEMVLQLISCDDMSIIWWQSVDFTSSAPPTLSDQQELFQRMFVSLLPNLAKREKVSPKVQPAPQMENQPSQDKQPSRKTEPGSKPRRRSKPEEAPKPEDVSPM